MKEFEELINQQEEERSDIRVKDRNTLYTCWIEYVLSLGRKKQEEK